MGAMSSDDSTVSALRPGDEVRGVFACTRKDRLITRTGSPVPGARAARPHGHDRRRGRSATPTRWPAASTAAISCGWRAGSSGSATSWWSRSLDISRAARRGGDGSEERRSGARSCPPRTATSTSSTASSSTSRARSTTAGYRALLDVAARRTRRCGRRGGGRRARGPATTRTSAGCSSTRSRSRRSRTSCASCTRG